MSKVIAFESITLDGVMQAPGRRDEDRRGGFEHGGWAAPYSDAEMGKDLVMLGSGRLARTLMHEHLIDEYVLLIHPLVLGSGQRLFTDDGDLSKFKLVDTKTTSKGVVIATYSSGA